MRITSHTLRRRGMTPTAGQYRPTRSFISCSTSRSTCELEGCTTRPIPLWLNYGSGDIVFQDIRAFGNATSLLSYSTVSSQATSVAHVDTHTHRSMRHERTSNHGPYTVPAADAHQRVMCCAACPRNTALRKAASDLLLHHESFRGDHAGVPASSFRQD